MKRFFMALVLITSTNLVFSQLIWNGSSTSWNKGSGTELDPFLIESPEQLNYLSSMVRLDVDDYKNVYFLQTEDFDLNNTIFSPIGSGNTIFRGNYDGGGHSIQNLNLNIDDNLYLALFGKVEGSKICNLTIKGNFKSSSINDNYGGEKEYKAGVVAYATNITITNCVNEASISNTNSYKTPSYAGGIVAYLSGNNTITGCANKGSIRATSYYYSPYAGGIIGYISSGTSTITSCSNTGYVSATSSQSVVVYSGGLIGYINSGNNNISNCSNSGSVSSYAGSSYGYGSDRYIAGGLVAYISSGSPTFIDCVNNGNVSSSSKFYYYSGYEPTYSGGLVGIGFGNFIRCTNKGYLGSPTTYKGGLISQCTSSTYLEECKNTQNVNGNYAGGLIGQITGIATIKKSANTGNVTGREYAGGLIGSGHGIISYSFNSGDIDVSNTATPHVGGFIGEGCGEISYSLCNSNNIANSTSSNAVAYAGGMVGLANGELSISFAGYVGKVSSSVNETSYAHAGGLIGGVLNGINNSTISNCYARCPIVCDGQFQSAYGLGKNSSVNNSYYVGTLTASTSSYSLTSSTAENSYYNSDCGASITQGTAKTHEEFKNAEMISLLNHSSTVWSVDVNKINDGYPIFEYSNDGFSIIHLITLKCDTIRGTVSGGGLFADETIATITATSKNGYVFVNWSDGNTDNPRELKVSQNLSLEAYFEPIKSFYISSSCNRNGKTFSYVHTAVDLGLSIKWATMNVGAYNPEDYGDYFAWGEIIPKSSYDLNNYKFWKDTTYNKYVSDSTCYGNNGKNVTLDPEDDAATMIWGSEWRMPTMGEVDELRDSCIWIDSTMNNIYGSYVIGPNGNYIFLPAAGSFYGDYKYDSGDPCCWTSTLFCSSSYIVAQYYHDGNHWGMDEIYSGHTIRPVSSTSTTQKSKTLTLYASTCDESNKFIFENDTTIEISAIEGHGNIFIKWSDGNTDNPRTITLTQDTVLTAEFAINQYAISTTPSHKERGTTAGDTTANYLDTITISAIANYGYHFTQWNDGNTENPRQVQVTENKKYTAYFDKNVYQITLNSDSIQGTIEYLVDSLPAQYLDTISFLATANYGYHFVQWSDGNTDNPRTLILTQDTVLTAEFAINQYAISTTPSHKERGTTAGDTTANHLDTVTISAIANYGYHFTRWDDGNTENPRRVQVTEDKKYTAYFDKNIYQITINYNTEHGTVEGSSYAQYLDTIDRTAYANYGYHFVQWSDSVTDNPRTLVVTQDTVLTAEFALTTAGQCGKNLYWVYNTNTTTLTITGSGDMYDERPWGLLANDLTEVALPSGITHIGNDAFSNCVNLRAITIPATVTTIGDQAFAGCRNLRNVNCYPLLPPYAETTSFFNYNVNLNVPCDYLEDYQYDLVFGSFKYINCISSDEVKDTEDVEIDAGQTDVTIIWPSADNAYTYTILIKKNGEVVCTLVFDAFGRLLNIAFAPGRDGNHRPAQYAKQTATGGFRFTVTGLEEGTDYTYSITSTDESDNTISSHSGEFTTKSDTSTAVENTSSLSLMTDCQKIIHDNQLLILRDGKIYNVIGQEL